jgi:hypothetical protein
MLQSLQTPTYVVMHIVEDPGVFEWRVGPKELFWFQSVADR